MAKSTKITIEIRDQKGNGVLRTEEIKGGEKLNPNFIRRVAFIASLLFNFDEEFLKTVEDLVFNQVKIQNDESTKS